MNTETGNIREIPEGTMPATNETEIGPRERDLLMRYEPRHRPRVLELLRELNSIPTAAEAVQAHNLAVYRHAEAENRRVVNDARRIRTKRRHERNRQARASRRRNLRGNS